MTYIIRKAKLEDKPAIEKLIGESVRGLGGEDYDEEQIEYSVKTVFGVDLQLISDRTYFVVESGDGRIAGCGGWGKRKILYGASVYTQSRDPDLLDPATGAAKIRAFFVHPDFARQGIGTLILEACESEARAYGFQKAEMMATLPGVKLYAARGYSGDEECKIPVGENVEITCVKMMKNLI